MESSYCQQAVTFVFFLVFNLQLAWPPHSLACSTAPVSTYHAYMIIFSFVATKYLDIASIYHNAPAPLQQPQLSFLLIKMMLDPTGRLGVGCFISHVIGIIVENAYPSLNINRFKADSLYGTLDYHLLI